mmetsp:Transcript_22426/g.55551  ORF Transcript_22426/g.55551 Transcript_22426/m.55551 type:complete len:295 (+) Transcript_22426:936-1820(+)
MRPFRPQNLEINRIVQRQRIAQRLLLLRGLLLLHPQIHHRLHRLLTVPQPLLRVVLPIQHANARHNPRRRPLPDLARRRPRPPEPDNRRAHQHGLRAERVDEHGRRAGDEGHLESELGEGGADGDRDEEVAGEDERAERRPDFVRRRRERHGLEVVLRDLRRVGAVRQDGGSLPGGALLRLLGVLGGLLGARLLLGHAEGKLPEAAHDAVDGLFDLLGGLGVLPEQPQHALQNAMVADLREDVQQLLQDVGAQRREDLSDLADADENVRRDGTEGVAEEARDDVDGGIRDVGVL